LLGGGGTGGLTIGERLKKNLSGREGKRNQAPNVTKRGKRKNWHKIQVKKVAKVKGREFPHESPTFV